MSKRHALGVVTSISLISFAGCPEKEDYRKQRPADEPMATGGDTKPPPPPPPKKKGPPADLGSCAIDVSGGITTKIEGKGGTAATNVSWWLSEDERKNMMGVDGYAVNCVGSGARFSLVPGGGKPDAMPFGPKKFTFAKGKSEGATVLVTFGQQTLSDANGTVEVTALDKRHIAGTVDLSGKVVPGNKQVKVSGTFDFVCPGMSACEFE